MHRSTRRPWPGLTNRFQPRSEALEPRLVLACDIMQLSTLGKLKIEGDMSAEVVEIVDFGGDVSVSCRNRGDDRSNPLIFSGVTEIKVALKEGDDRLDYFAEHDDVTKPLAPIKASLGDGNDIGNVNVVLGGTPVDNNGTSNGQFYLSIHMDADAGDDLLYVDIVGTFTIGNLALDAQINGGTGQDTKTFISRTEGDELTLTTRELKQSIGEDVIVGVIDSATGESYGRVSGSEVGEVISLVGNIGRRAASFDIETFEGDDELFVDVSTTTRTESLQVAAELGDGSDTGEVVVVTKVEEQLNESSTDITLDGGDGLNALNCYMHLTGETQGTVVSSCEVQNAAEMRLQLAGDADVVATGSGGQANGTVKWFNDQKGFGFIQGSRGVTFDGSTVTLDISDVTNVNISGTAHSDHPTAFVANVATDDEANDVVLDPFGFFAYVTFLDTGGGDDSVRIRGDLDASLLSEWDLDTGDGFDELSSSFNSSLPANDQPVEREFSFVAIGAENVDTAFISDRLSHSFQAQASDPFGPITSYEYDHHDRLISSVSSSAAGFTDVVATVESVADDGKTTSLLFEGANPTSDEPDSNELGLPGVVIYLDWNVSAQSANVAATGYRDSFVSLESTDVVQQFDGQSTNGHEIPGYELDWAKRLSGQAVNFESSGYDRADVKAHYFNGRLLNATDLNVEVQNASWLDLGISAETDVGTIEPVRITKSADATFARSQQAKSEFEFSFRGGEYFFGLIEENVGPTDLTVTLPDQQANTNVRPLQDRIVIQRLEEEASLGEIKLLAEGAQVDVEFEQGEKALKLMADGDTTVKAETDDGTTVTNTENSRVSVELQLSGNDHPAVVNADGFQANDIRIIGTHHRDAAFVRLQTATDSDSPSEVVFEGSDGDDTAAILVEGTINNRVDIALNGGPDDDELIVDALQVPISDTGALTVRSLGEDGDDHQSFQYSGLAHGLTHVVQQGGRGNDSIVGMLTIERGSRGYVNVHTQGNDDNDRVGLAVFGVPSDPSQPWDLTLDGGSGFDRCAATDNVMANGCEEIDDLAALELVDLLFPENASSLDGRVHGIRYTLFNNDGTPV